MFTQTFIFQPLNLNSWEVFWQVIRTCHSRMGFRWTSSSEWYQCKTMKASTKSWQLVCFERLNKLVFEFANLKMTTFSASWARKSVFMLFTLERNSLYCVYTRHVLRIKIFVRSRSQHFQKGGGSKNPFSGWFYCFQHITFSKCWTICMGFITSTSILKS